METPAAIRMEPATLSATDFERTDALRLEIEGSHATGPGRGIELVHVDMVADTRTDTEPSREAVHGPQCGSRREVTRVAVARAVVRITDVSGERVTNGSDDAPESRIDPVAVGDQDVLPTPDYDELLPVDARRPTTTSRGGGNADECCDGDTRPRTHAGLTLLPGRAVPPYGITANAETFGLRHAPLLTTRIGR